MLRTQRGRQVDSTMNGKNPTPADEPVEAPANGWTYTTALETLRYQLACWRSASLDGYDPGDLAEAAEALLDHLDRTPQSAGGPVPVSPPVDAIEQRLGGF